MIMQLYRWLKKTDLYFTYVTRRFPKFSIEGECKMTGNCCRQLILVDRGRSIRSLTVFNALVRREPFHEMFVPLDEKDSEGRLRFSCSNLTHEHRCGIYHSRPDFCRSYPEPLMFKL